MSGPIPGTYSRFGAHTPAASAAKIGPSTMALPDAYLRTPAALIYFLPESAGLSENSELSDKRSLRTSEQSIGT
jgi:hypothetical protein